MSLTVGLRESVVRPGNSQMKEVLEMLTAVGLCSEDLTLKILQQIYFPKNKKKIKINERFRCLRKTDGNFFEVKSLLWAN